MAFSLGEKSPEHYCGSCLAVPGIWQYASLEDCICDCHQKAVPPLHWVLKRNVIYMIILGL